MVFKNMVMVAMLFALLAGCARSDSDDVKEQAEDIRDNVHVTADHVWKAQVKALDKAKSVGQDLMDAAAEQRQAMERDSE
jgi:hypothetical protein